MSRDAALLRPKRDRARVEFDPTVLPAHYSSVFSAARIKVLGALVDRLPRHRAAVVSRRDLTQATGLSRRTVENAMRLAREWGLIREWQQHPGEEANTVEIISAEWRAWIDEQRPRPAQKRASLRK